MYLCRRLQRRRVRAAMDAADASSPPRTAGQGRPVPGQWIGCSGSPADVLGRSGDRPVAAVVARTSVSGPASRSRDDREEGYPPSSEGG